MIDDNIVIGFVTAVGGFVAWLVKYQMTSLKDTIDKNTNAINSIANQLGVCKFVNELRKDP